MRPTVDVCVVFVSQGASWQRERCCDTKPMTASKDLSITLRERLRRLERLATLVAQRQEPNVSHSLGS